MFLCSFVVALVCFGFSCFVVVRAMGSIVVMYSRMWIAMFLNPLTLWFSRFRCCLSLETTLSTDALYLYRFFSFLGP